VGGYNPQDRGATQCVVNMKMEISRQRSCTLKGNLNFNWRLIKAPQFVINYVVIHELAHLIDLNHSERFWNIVQVQMPNYLEAKEWLKGEWGNDLLI
jgi:predicted metal-dependent hydrolase